jgi:hypothetical protein
MCLAHRFSQSVIASKYLGGHSDLLGGVLIVKTPGEWGKVCAFLVPRSLSLMLYTLAPAGSYSSWRCFGLLGIMVAAALVTNTPPPCPTAVRQRHCVSSVAEQHRIYSQGPVV